MTNSDEQIRRSQDGDLAAFSTLVELHYPSCLRVAWNRLGDREDAEDVVQDALIQAYRTIRRDGAPRRFRPWLITIVIRQCATLAAKRARRRRLLELFRRRTEAEPEYVAPWEPEGLSDPRLEAALESLSPGLRAAFLLKHVEELTYEEIAQATGIGVSALKMRVKRASEQLLAHLTEQDGTRPLNSDAEGSARSGVQHRESGADARLRAQGRR